MDEREFCELLSEALYDSEDAELEVGNIGTFAECGLLTSNEGIVVALRDGSEFQVTVVQSRRGEK